MQEKVYRHIYT